METPRENFAVKHTFVTVEEDETVELRKRASKRRSSCPPNLLKMQHNPETVVMLQNLPNRATKVKVQSHVVSLGVKPDVVLDLPLDRRTGVNKGYAFLTFHSMKDAKKFVKNVEGTQLRGSRSAKRLAAVLALGHRLTLKRAAVPSVPASWLSPVKQEGVQDRIAAAAAACC